MRILHASDVYLPGLGGIETHVFDLASRQCARGDVATVATRAPGGRASQDDGPVPVRRVGTATELPLDGYDVVHAHLSGVSPFASRLAVRAARTGVPTVLTVHSLWSGLGPVPTLAAGAYGLWFAPVVWTAVSHAAAELLRTALPGGPEVRVVPNAVEAAPRPATEREHYEPVRIVSTMRLAARKRPRQLVDIVRRLRDRTAAPFQLVVVGDGPLRAALDRKVRRAGLTDVVTMTGRLPRSDVLDVVAAADVYVAPAVRESFGIAALEARSLGLPVVGRSNTGLTEFVTNGVNGLLAGSDREMVDALQRLVEDHELRGRLSEHNRTTPTRMTWRYALARNDAAYAHARRVVAGARDPVRRLRAGGIASD